MNMSETTGISEMLKNLDMMLWHFFEILGTQSLKKCVPELMITSNCLKNPTSHLERVYTFGAILCMAAYSPHAQPQWIRRKNMAPFMAPQSTGCRRILTNLSGKRKSKTPVYQRYFFFFLIYSDC
jgi:hypothetical protein